MSGRDLVIVRGGGDLATGVIQKLHRVGFNVLALEVEAPLAIRRTVALSEAVYEGVAQVEDIKARLVSGDEGIKQCFANGEVAMMIDPAGESIWRLQPDGVIDTILAKRNLGTSIDMANVVIGVGPGFTAGIDVHGVIETMRGHDLGRLILQGTALSNTGIPGELGGRSIERVMHAPCDGVVHPMHRIGDVVHAGEVLFSVGEMTCIAPFDGLLRGMIRGGLKAMKGMKIADVDPRIDVDWRTISDKARCIGGGVLEAYLYMKDRGECP